MTNPEYERYLESDEWNTVKQRKQGPRKCVGCDGRRGLQLHHMVYPKDIWQTRPEHCCWLCDRCHGVLHRAPAKYIAIATTDGWTRMVIHAQQKEEDAGIQGIGDWAGSSITARKLGLAATEPRAQKVPA